MTGVAVVNSEVKLCNVTEVRTDTCCLS